MSDPPAAADARSQMLAGQRASELKLAADSGAAIRGEEEGVSQ